MYSSTFNYRTTGNRNRPLWSNVKIYSLLAHYLCWNIIIIYTHFSRNRNLYSYFYSIFLNSTEPTQKKNYFWLQTGMGNSGCQRKSMFPSPWRRKTPTVKTFSICLLATLSWYWAKTDSSRYHKMIDLKYVSVFLNLIRIHFTECSETERTNWKLRREHWYQNHSKHKRSRATCIRTIITWFLCWAYYFSNEQRTKKTGISNQFRIFS